MPYKTFLTPKRELRNVHPIHPDYPLLPGDLLEPGDDGTYDKWGPGLGILGFTVDPTDLEPKTVEIFPPSLMYRDA